MSTCESSLMGEIVLALGTESRASGDRPLWHVLRHDEVGPVRRNRGIDFDLDRGAASGTVRVGPNTGGADIPPGSAAIS